MKQIKTINLLLILSIFFVVSAQGQSLIVPGKTWTYLLEDGIPGSKPNNDECLRIGGDTLISNTNYYKLMYSLGCDETNWRIKGFIRETEDSLVFYCPNYSSAQEFLLYDFGIQVGDSVYVTPNPSRLDSIRETNKGQKIYYLSGSYSFNDRWIEGVGSEIGLLMEVMTGSTLIFTCCLLNGEELYHNPFYDECYFVTGVSLLDQADRLVKVFLNSTGSLAIIPLNDQAEGLFELYSMNGHLIVRKRIKGKSEVCVDTRGIFSYRFTSGKGVIVRGKVAIM